MIRTILTTALLTAAAPAVAGERIGTDNKVPAHCTKQMVHTPAGKTVHNAPVLFCAEKTREVAVNEDRARKVARD